MICIVVLLASCQVNQSKEKEFEYEPSVPYPILNPGDFWPKKFDQRGLQNATIYNDRIYCNTVDEGGSSNFLYCFNLINGLVEWRAHVKSYACQPVVLCDGAIVYCSCLGDASAYNDQGELMWENKFDYPYAGHWVDTASSRLLIKTAYWKNVSVYDIRSGKLVAAVKSDSLQSVINDKANNGYSLQPSTYQFERKGVNYVIDCKRGENGECKIEINNQR